MIVAIQDASHANAFDQSASGTRMGYCSQSGRVLCLTDKSIKNRVSRSTLQSETLSLVLGSEEEDHLRYVLHGLTNTLYKEPDFIAAMDSIDVMWVTDCYSLFEHIIHAGLQNVSDKRLAQVW
jgi:hypothetical protein